MKTYELSGLEDKVAVVTGAGRMRSIGRPVAVELARASSPNGFLVKPFHADALFKFIDAILADRRAAEGQSEPDLD